MGQTASWVGQGVLYRNTMKIDHIIEKFRQKNNSYCERERERERERETNPSAWQHFFYS